MHAPLRAFQVGVHHQGGTGAQLLRPRPETHPGLDQVAQYPDVLRQPEGESADDAVSGDLRELSIPPGNREIVRGKRSVTPDTALRLARVTGMGADFRLGLQQDWDLWHALTAERAAAIALLEPLPRPG